MLIIIMNVTNIERLLIQHISHTEINELQLCVFSIKQ